MVRVFWIGVVAMVALAGCGGEAPVRFSKPVFEEGAGAEAAAQGPDYNMDRYSLPEVRLARRQGRIASVLSAQ